MTGVAVQRPQPANSIQGAAGRCWRPSVANDYSYASKPPEVAKMGKVSLSAGDEKYTGIRPEVLVYFILHAYPVNE